MNRKNGLLSLAAAGAVGLAVGGVASAQSVCLRPVGPDVIVGDIQGFSNFNAANGLDAFSGGTYSCNVGNANVQWIAGNNQHPVIAQNMFKYKVQPQGYATFEQIGMSWLKHGFLALNNQLCCTQNCQNTNGTALGVSCADPYTAARNASQSGLGPRWQVNAASGVYTYPPANPTWSGSTARRLQVALTDLEASSANVRFFIEAQYVTADDHQAGNSDNNNAYRELGMTVTVNAQNEVTNGNIATFNGATQREKVAIEAWKAIDPSVTLTSYKIPTDGRVLVASKATDIGGGVWHYEYAVYNQTSDRSVGAFTVPVPDGATVTNIGFHDVSYRNGDGIGNTNADGTDWTSTRSANSLTWNTVSFASNPNGNAIRWGTMYNFRFDANVAPAAMGTASFDTWKVAGTQIVPAQVPGEFTGGACYANCDESTTVPVLNVNDFVCFQQKFAAGDSYANCDESTTVPVLNVNDFVCFQQQFAAGCK